MTIPLLSDAMLVLGFVALALWVLDLLWNARAAELPNMQMLLVAVTVFAAKLLLEFPSSDVALAFCSVSWLVVAKVHGKTLEELQVQQDRAGSE